MSKQEVVLDVDMTLSIISNNLPKFRIIFCKSHMYSNFVTCTVNQILLCDQHK